MRKNCIVLDNGYSYSLHSKTIQSPEGEQIADLYDIDTSKLTEEELITLIVLFVSAYNKGKKCAETKFRKKLLNFFDFPIDNE